MSIEQMAGQVMLVGTPLSNIGSIDATIKEYDLGGVFLSGRSTASAATLRKAITKLQSEAPADMKLFIALDQEGGEVQTLKGSDFPLIPTAQAQGGETAAALRAQVDNWSNRLADIGVNLDLAPVADTVPASLGTKNPPIGAFHRQYGSDPAKVSADITIVVDAIQSNGVTTTLKHFPGLGRVLVNTDFGEGATDATMTAHDSYLEPFEAGIKAGSGAVMIASASYPKLDDDSIATWSKPIVTGLLRDQLGFKGMIVSDSLAGAAAVSDVPAAQRGVRFIQAGGDLVLSTTASTGVKIRNGIVAEAKKSPAFVAQLRTAVTYDERAKLASGLLTCAP